MLRRIALILALLAGSAAVGCMDTETPPGVEPPDGGVPAVDGAAPPDGAMHPPPLPAPGSVRP